ncbi:hypothetical protein AXY34_05710 [Mammaliicoccus lentus]|nr:hypothetical protein AXY34_05710 [Mammaliicoccus lentus]
MRDYRLEPYPRQACTFKINYINKTPNSDIQSLTNWKFFSKWILIPSTIFYFEVYLVASLWYSQRLSILNFKIKIIVLKEWFYEFIGNKH